MKYFLYIRLCISILFAEEKGQGICIESGDDDDDDDDDVDEPPYCPCGAENNEMMIWCDGDDRCPNKWFHYECVGLAPRTIPTGKWYCSG